MIIKIYQVKRDLDDRRDISFESYDYVSKKHDVKKEFNELYDKVYEYDEVNFRRENEYARLEEIFHKFNVNRPDDFKGHSLSVSDIVEMNNKLYYCDRWEWIEI